MSPFAAVFAVLSKKYETATYPGEVKGARFRIVLNFREVRVWIDNGPEPVVIKSADLQQVTSLLDGSTKIAVALHRDVLVPSSRAESSLIVDALNALLAEQDAVR